MNTKQIFEDALALAKDMGHEYLLTDHVFYVIVSNNDTHESIKTLFKEFNLDLTAVARDIHAGLSDPEIVPMIRAGQQIKPSTACEHYFNIIRKMVMLNSITEEVVSVTIFNLLTELLAFEGTYSEYVLNNYNVTVDDILLILEQKQDDEEYQPMAMDEATPTRKKDTDAIKDYCFDVTAAARKGKIGKIIGREQEIRDIAQVLARKQKNNVALVGEPGVGKTQIVEGLALAIAKGTVEDSLKNKRILSLNVSGMLAGAKFRGDFEARVEGVLEGLGDDDILFIDEIHMIMGTGSGQDSQMDLANMLKPYLSRGEISVIGTTTYKDYQKSFQKDPALERRFMKLDVVEPTKAETKKILAGVKSVYQKHHKCTYTKEAMEAVLNLSETHIHDRFWPDKAIDLLDAAGARLEGDERVVDVDQIAYEVSRICNLPIDSLVKSEAKRMKDLKKTLSSRVFGQDEAVEKLTNSVMVARAGLRGTQTAQGGYLFVGSSGVGKTEIAKALAESLQSELVRIDMSEFGEKHTVSRLIGSPPGYVGSSDSDGVLIEQISRHPNCVLLLDEVEKAHPDVFNIFLSALDEGHLTSLSSGKKVKLNNVTVIMTTNLGSRDSSKKAIGYQAEGKADGIDVAVKSFFRPEFINRLDGIVKFNDLSDDVLVEVTKKFVKQVNDEVKASGVKIKLGKEAIEWVVRTGKTPGMGARPIARIIHEKIKTPLAPEMIFGSLTDGGVAEFVVQDDDLVLVTEK